MTTFTGFDVLPSGTWDCGAGVGSASGGDCGCKGSRDRTCDGGCGCDGDCGVGCSGASSGFDPVHPAPQPDLRWRDYDGQLMSSKAMRRVQEMANPCPEPCRDLANAFTRCCGDAYNMAQSEEEYHRLLQKKGCSADAFVYNDFCGGYEDCPDLVCPIWDKGCGPERDTPERQKLRRERCEELTKALDCTSSTSRMLCEQMMRACYCTEEEFKKHPWLRTWCVQAQQAFFTRCVYEKDHGGGKWFPDYEVCMRDCEQEFNQCLLDNLLQGSVLGAGALGVSLMGTISKNAMKRLLLSNGAGALLGVAGVIWLCTTQLNNCRSKCDRKLRRSMDGSPGGF
jgi:hypothetical protein